MDRFMECKFAIYFNSRNKHVKKHKIPTPHDLEKNNATNISKSGGWGYFVTEFEADEFAKSISNDKKIPFYHCTFCFGNNVS